MKGLSKPNEQGKNNKVSRLRGIEKNEKTIYRTKLFLSTPTNTGSNRRKSMTESSSRSHTPIWRTSENFLEVTIRE